jgi:hypothetical protein
MSRPGQSEVKKTAHEKVSLAVPSKIVLSELGKNQKKSEAGLISLEAASLFLIIT